MDDGSTNSSAARLIERASEVGVIPVIRIERLDDAVALAESLYEGGLTVLEVTLRTPDALRAVQRIRTSLPDAFVGAGTVLGAGQYRNAVDSGAQFVISPGVSDALIDAAFNYGLPFLPGTATASDVMRCIDAGIRACKFFPAAAAGGTSMLRAFAGPFGDMQFCPTGGIGEANLGDFLGLGNVFCVGGSWMLPADVIAARDWVEIRRLAESAVRAARTVIEK